MGECCSVLTLDSFAPALLAVAPEAIGAFFAELSMRQCLRHIRFDEASNWLAVAIRTRVFVFTFFDFYLIWSVDFYL
jgi:hypothetical protein